MPLVIVKIFLVMENEKNFTAFCIIVFLEQPVRVLQGKLNVMIFSRKR